MRIGDRTRGVPDGLVENKARQALARALMRDGPLTARGLMKDTGRSMACARYHLRVLSTAGAVTPCLTGAAKDDEVAYALRPERLPKQAREVLLGEVSLQVCLRLMGILLLEGPRDVTELAARLGLSRREVGRYVKTLKLEQWTEGTPHLGTGARADRVSDYPEWLRRCLDRLDDEGGDLNRREDGAE